MSAIFPSTSTYTTFYTTQVEYMCILDLQLPTLIISAPISVLVQLYRNVLCITIYLLCPITLTVNNLTLLIANAS